jgi:hypothetical protein
VSYWCPIAAGHSIPLSTAREVVRVDPVRIFGGIAGCARDRSTASRTFPPMRSRNIEPEPPDYRTEKTESAQPCLSLRGAPERRVGAIGKDFFADAA